MRHPEDFNTRVAGDFSQAGEMPLLFRNLNYTHSVADSKALNYKDGPLMVISASGMCEGGRILHHLKNNVENPLNTICIVSWQAPHTLGRRLADREKQIKIFGEPYMVKAEVATIGGLSGHAGQDLLTKYAANVKGSVRKVFLVHGEAIPAATLTQKLLERNMREVYYPELHSTTEL